MFSLSPACPCTRGRVGCCWDCLLSHSKQSQSRNQASSLHSRVSDRSMRLRHRDERPGTTWPCSPAYLLALQSLSPLWLLKTDQCSLPCQSPSGCSESDKISTNGDNSNPYFSTPVKVKMSNEDARRAWPLVLYKPLPLLQGEAASCRSVLEAGWGHRKGK